MLAIDEVYDVEKKGTHLVLRYDQVAKAFLGTVENVSDEMLTRVRVEVHLSSGKELGPTVAAVNTVTKEKVSTATVKKAKVNMATVM